MGDRANIKVKSSEGEMHFYSHWNGSLLPVVLRDALKRKARWDDEQYLNRIIFCEMIKNNVNDETGYGLSVGVGDGDGRIVEVDTDSQEVTLKGKTYSFEEYIKLPEKCLEY